MSNLAGVAVQTKRGYSIAEIAVNGPTEEHSAARSIVQTGEIFRDLFRPKAPVNRGSGCSPNRLKGGGEVLSDNFTET